MKDLCLVKDSLCKQFVVFVLVGTLGTAAHFITLITLVEVFLVSSVVSSTLGFLIGSVVNYYYNSIFTFKENKLHIKYYAKFLSVAALGMILNAFIMANLENKFFYLVNQIAASSIVLFWNFCGNRFWTFKESRNGG